MRAPRPPFSGRGWLFIVCLVLAAVLFDSTIVEPNWIRVVRSVASLPLQDPTAPALTLVHISDIHIGELGYRERRAIRLINDESPDLIVLSGDLVHRSCHPRDLQDFLGALHARYGKFLVWGNHDYWSHLPETSGPDIVRLSGFTLLRNSSTTVACPGGPIVIAGLDDPITGHDNLRLTLDHVARGDPCILVCHTPEIAGELGHQGIDLVLAGHTHGGQVRLPFVGAPVVPFGTRDYVEGWFDLSPRTRMHVSSGLGWSYLPIRFLCPSTIDVIKLVPRPGTPAAAGDVRASHVR